MTVTGSDSRLSTTDFTTFPLNAVVAVDIYDRSEITPNFRGNFEGSGITIAPNYVLTAGHNVYNNKTKKLAFALRTTTSANQPALATRDLSRSASSNVLEPFFFPKRYDISGASEDDIALLKTEDEPITATNTIGLLAFVNPETAQNLSILSAGYPSEFTTYDNLPLGRSLVLSPGTGTASIVITQGNGRFFYSDDADSERGHSGSGVWHILDGDIAPRVLGVHIEGYDKNSPVQRNNGVLITTDVYDAIVKQIETDSGITNADELPENAIVGSDVSDSIFGSYRKERILGGSGDDRLFGGGAADRLEGGEGTDQALFSDVFTNYTYSITDPNNKYFTFDHTSGTRANGIDSLKEIEFGVFEFEDANKDKQDDDGNLFYVPLLVDPKNSSKIKDGVEIKPSQDILNNSGSKIGTITVKSPAWTFDGDIDFSLTLTKPSTAFNFAYIIDTSNSMAGAPLALAKNAAKTLTQSLIDKGIAANSSFAIIPFNSTATLTGPIDANAIISAIDSLTANGNSKFVPALNLAQLFFWSRTNNATNIAYFLSDGFGTGANEDLQSIAEVRAFAVGAADIDSLDIIDSDEAEVLNDPADLATKFTGGTFDRSKIARINVKLGNITVQTIDPDQLTTDTQGNLTYDGSITNLTVSRTANNLVSFDIEFNDGTPTANLNYRITSGQEEIRIQSADGTREAITFSVNQNDFTEAGTAESAGGITGREINGNEIANVITVNSGKNTLRGDRGDDLFILNGGTNVVDGGEGIDTVKLNNTQATTGAITKNGNTIKIGTNITLQNVEFIELNEVRLSTDTLAIVPIISLQNRFIAIAEGNEGSTLATFVVNLSSPSTQDIAIDYATRSRNAIAGKDFTANIGNLIIAAGETTGTISIDILGNTQATGDKQLLLDLSTSSGATFANGKTKDTAGVNIQDDDTAIGISLTADRTSFFEGNLNSPASVVITIDRFGNLNGIDTIGYQIIPTGDRPVAADDFVNGFTPGQITFAPGEYSKTLEIPISPDLDVEGDESFALNLSSLSGSATVPSGDLQLTIRDSGVINRRAVINDFGKDYKSDILWRNIDGRVVVWQMDGSVIFSDAFVDRPAPLDWKIAGTGDFDGDRKSDILWRNIDGQVVIWQMDGATVLSDRFIDRPASLDWHIVSTGDFNGDNKSDILWRNDDGRVVIWQMDGAVVLSDNFIDRPASLDWHIVSTGDFNGDNKSDILWRNDNGRVVTWQMNGAIVLSDNFIDRPAPLDWQIVSNGDFNGDNKSDILWRNDDGRVVIWQMDGAIVLSDNFIDRPAPLDWKIAGTGDLNGDSKSDILWRNNDGRVVEWLLDGTTVIADNFVANVDNGWQIVAPTSSLPLIKPAKPPNLEEPNAVKNDFGKDNKSDILWRNIDGRVVLWQMDGATVLSDDFIERPAPLDWQIAGTGDFNGDQKSDILWRNIDGRVVLWQMDGATVLSDNFIEQPAPLDWQIAGTGDFNGDQKSDILWRNDDGRVVIWQMDGTTVLSDNLIDRPAPLDWQIAGTGDFNGDQKSDILWRNEDGRVVIWQMDGATVLSDTFIDRAISNDWVIQGVDDFNNDGKSDILWRNKNSGLAYIYEMNNNSIINEGIVGQADGDWQIAGTGDYNGDFYADILWRNDSGLTYLWIMNGLNQLGQKVISQVDNSWQIAAPTN
jgi:V8-like Glu-specific endopeptidase